MLYPIELWVRMFSGLPEMSDRWIVDPGPSNDRRCQDCSRFGPVLKACQGHSQESIKSLAVRTKSG